VSFDDLAARAFRAFPWPLAVLDARGVIIETNAPWREGRSSLEMLVGGLPGRGDDLVAHLRAGGHGAQHLADEVRAVLSGDRAEAESEISLGDAGYRMLATALDDDGDRAVLVVLRRALRDERHRAIFVASPVGIALLDAQGRTLETNPALRRLLDPKAAAGNDEPGVIEALAADERPRARAALRRLCAGEAGGWVRETSLKARDGRKVPVRMHVSASRRAESAPLAVVLVEDISERTRLEQQLGQAQRIESIGRLAGGIAHDFNNLVTIIRGHTDLLLDDMSADDPLRADLEDIRNAGERAAALTGQLLAFSRRNVLQPKVLDLNAVVRGMEALLRRTLGEDVALSIDLEEPLGPIRADPSQMEQVLLNLVVNARDSMPRGGRLAIRTFDRRLDETFVSSHLGASAGPHVAVQVEDAGHGMDQATMDLIFEPFFTTKEPGKGTGLGLAMSYGIVKQSGGYIDVESSPGLGTTFTIYLPRVSAWKARAPDQDTRPATTRGSETVLLVEDEPSVRQLAARVLEGRGYTVLGAGTGEEALLAARAHPGPVHLLLTDVVMPGMGGRELADRMKAEMPSLKVLYTSGYTDDEIVRRGVSEHSMPFLAKPFTPDELAESVRVALDT
jgi:PAS domain S-box-containing protein